MKCPEERSGGGRMAHTARSREGGAGSREWLCRAGDGCKLGYVSYCAVGIYAMLVDDG
ncbi:hypothetical protein B0T18DRAFT_404614 [Schizothecium vesticola]|uniref:Uncharacterized protein n=1 Tax=Schizothecium vesticola TaxID=314040 RepID=A0AA40KB86_9PEZI|nr:hypothetical protein B0T18DRAFT_404614 [Schizothecium vesticola]